MSQKMSPWMLETASALAEIAQSQLLLVQQTSDWQTKYRALMQLGQKLPVLPASELNDDKLIQGCDSKAWLLHQQDPKTLRHYWAFHSEARIIKGLIILLLCQINGKTSQELQQIDLKLLLAFAGLQQNFSPSRQNGIAAVIAQLNQYQHD